MKKDTCINCGISNVPLIVGLDNQLHCESHISMLVSENKKEEHDNVSENQQPGN